MKIMGPFHLVWGILVDIDYGLGVKMCCTNFGGSEVQISQR